MLGGGGVIYEFKKEDECDKLRKQVASLEEERTTTMSLYLSTLKVPDEIG
jgi:hypothetical protein